jgi:glycosyltransferase involved in cell wall biosynthesis
MNRKLKTPSVCVITRTQDRPITLQRLAQNLRAQSFNDFEWLVINDAGNHTASRKIVADYARSGRKARHIENLISKGRSFPINYALKRTKANYIVIIDDDDFLDDDALSQMHDFLCSHRSIEAVATYTQVVFEEIKDGRIVYRGLGGQFTPQLTDFRPENLFVINPCPIHSIMARRTAMLAAGGFPEDIEYTEDWCFWFRFSLKFTFGLIPKVLAYYVCNRSVRGSGTQTRTPLSPAELHNLYAQKWQKAYLQESGQLAGIIASAYYFQLKKTKPPIRQKIRTRLRILAMKAKHVIRDKYRQK